MMFNINLRGLHRIIYTLLKKERTALEDKRLDASASLDSLRSDYNDLLTAKRNVEAIMHEGQDLEQDKTRFQQIE